jgi:hypothetical protein
LAASFADLARLLPKKAGGGGGDKEPKKRLYVLVKDEALVYLAELADQGKEFKDEDAVMAELDAKNLNPEDPSVDTGTKTKDNVQEFNEAVKLLLKPVASPARFAYVFEETLATKLAGIEKAIRTNIRAGKKYGSIEEIRAVFGKQLESALPKNLSGLLEITAVNDHLRKYVDAIPEQLKPALRLAPSADELPGQVAMILGYLAEVDPTGKYKGGDAKYNFLRTELPDINSWHADDIKFLKEVLDPTPF